MRPAQPRGPGPVTYFVSDVDPLVQLVQRVGPTPAFHRSFALGRERLEWEVKAVQAALGW